MWKEASRIIEPAITYDNIYLRLSQDRNGIETRLKLYIFPELADISNDATDDCLTQNLAEPAIDPVVALRALLADDHFKPMFKELASDPLYFLYRWPEQIDICKTCSKHSNLPVILSMSDHFIDQAAISGTEYEGTYCCSLISEIDGQPTCFWQGLMQRKDPDFINYFLCEWLRETIPAPKQLITPPSSHLLDTSSLAFNHCRLIKYNVKCLKFL